MAIDLYTSYSKECAEELHTDLSRPQNCYIILGGWFPEMLYSVIEGGQKFPIFALYNMCTIPNVNHVRITNAEINGSLLLLLSLILFDRWRTYIYWSVSVLNFIVPVMVPIVECEEK